jgi:aminoglycoside phosphotransferase (APT) family kinase protein
VRNSSSKTQDNILGMDADLNELISRFDGAVLLDRGYSTDKKFRIGTERLLRVSPIELRSQRILEFEAVGALHEIGLMCSKAISFGEHRSLCYGLYSYIHGETLSDVLPALESPREVGQAAGRQLNIIHRFEKATELVNERSVREQKFEHVTARLTELCLDFEGSELVNRYVRSHLHLIEQRPSCFRHGDFHPGNLIVLDGALNGVIDFNRCDHGDPYDDFYKLAFFGAPVSSEFTCGLIEAYFDGSPSDDFWQIYNLYVGATLAADLGWTKTLFPEGLLSSLARIKHIIETHDFDKGGPPSWWTLNE